MASPTKNTPFCSVNCRIADTQFTIHGVRFIGFTEHGSMTSIQKSMTIAFFYDEIASEVFDIESLGKTLKIVSISTEGKDRIAKENQWTICSIGEVSYDPAFNRMLMEISLDYEIRGYFPEYDTNQR